MTAIRAFFPKIKALPISEKGEGRPPLPVLVTLLKGEQNISQLQWPVDVIHGN